jgi:hypothetical protein
MSLATETTNKMPDATERTDYVIPELVRWFCLDMFPGVAENNISKRVSSPKKNLSWTSSSPQIY